MPWLRQEVHPVIEDRVVESSAVFYSCSLPGFSPLVLPKCRIGSPSEPFLFFKLRHLFKDEGETRWFCLVDEQMSTQRTKGDAPEPRRNHLETHNEGDGSLRFSNDLLPNLGGGLVIKVWDLMSLSSCGGFRVLSLWKIHLTSLSPGSF